MIEVALSKNFNEKMKIVTCNSWQYTCTYIFLIECSIEKD